MNHIEEMLQSKTWAVVGATDNTQKFGYKIFKCLVNNKIQVFAVNPGVSEILGHKCYPSLKDLPQRPDAVNVVVPPRVGEQIMHECAELGIMNIWLQPGADTAELIELGQQLGLNVVSNACIMIELK
ncbi:CoA-binding protein [Dendrosporobacter sp. 1207_IL3150]|uniref:CoA-binding protein n=1 Tax=Dendrosporobacter sp. 1207_IL3150 TaxID=3084054 RepID=UPI002FD87D1E